VTPTREQWREAVAGGAAAGRNVSRVALVLVALGAVAVARVLHHYGWGFWTAVIAAGIVAGVVLGVIEGLKLLRR